MNANAEIIAELRRVLNERDEAREQLDLTKRELGRWVDREAKAVRERDEARASLAQIRRVFGNAIAFDDARGDIVKMAEIAYRGARDGDKAVGELRDMTRQRDEARAEVERLQETKDYLRTWLSSEELEGLRVKAAEHPLLWEEIHHWKAEVERLRAEVASSLAMARIADEKHGLKCAEVEVLRGIGCNEDGDGPCGVCRKCAYRRGAEAMREACLRDMERFMDADSVYPFVMAHSIRALPIPEEP